MVFENLIRQLLSGLSLGMVIFIIAAGLSLIFGTLKFLNMAHGSIYMLGAFLCYWLTATFSDVSGVFWWSLLLAPLGAALFGGLLEVLLLRRIYGWDMMYHWLLTFGLILFIGDMCKLLWGVEYYMVSTPWPLNGAVKFLGVYFPTYNFFVMAVGPLIFIGLWTLLRYTKLGRIIRAATHSPEMVNALGINVPLTYTAVFMLGCWLAGLGGSLMAPMAAVSLGMDGSVIVECFIIVVIGGLGSTLGAFIGAIIYGLAYAIGVIVFPKVAIGIGFILMAVILIIRPWGLMGRPE
jgi:branched-subunit amino acid ABC-type transport system permease component